MLPILEQLLVLQDRDIQIAQLKREAARIPLELAALDARLTEETSKLNSMQERLKHLEADRKKLEIDADSKRAQIAKWQTQLTQIKSNTEYQALLKEIAKAESEISAIEDRELEFMEQTERARPLFKEEQAELARIKQRGEEEKATLQQRRQTIEAEAAKLEADRHQLAAAVEPDALARYQRILRSKGDSAIAAIHAGNCGGCHLHIPPQVANEARAGLELVSCNYCGRLLYWPGE